MLIIASKITSVNAPQNSITYYDKGGAVYLVHLQMLGFQW